MSTFPHERLSRSEYHCLRSGRTPSTLQPFFCGNTVCARTPRPFPTQTLASHCCLKCKQGWQGWQGWQGCQGSYYESVDGGMQSKTRTEVTTVAKVCEQLTLSLREDMIFLHLGSFRCLEYWDIKPTCNPIDIGPQHLPCHAKELDPKEPLLMTVSQGV